MCILGGYKTQTVTQLANLIAAYDAGEISLSAVRVYLAALVSVASREAAKRSRMTSKGRGDLTPRYLLKELSRITGLPIKSISRELRTLKRLKLLSFGESEIIFEVAAKENANEILLSLAGGRSQKRPVPLPRPLLRFLARSSKPSVILTALIYAVRGLTLSRHGEIRGQGSVKATWIASVMGLSERSVRSARAELIKIGFISSDQNSTQRKLNRTGAYFEINLSWTGKAALVSEAVIHRRSGVGQLKAPIAETVDNCGAVQPKGQPEFAPPPTQNEAKFAPPYKYKKTPNGSKNQKTHLTQLSPAGVCTAKEESTKAKPLAAPSIRNVQREDLYRLSRMEALYFEACETGFVQASEASALAFLAAAIRARNVREGEGNSLRIFSGIIRRGLWQHITQAEEDEARRALARYREGDQARFRVLVMRAA